MSKVNREVALAFIDGLLEVENIVDNKYTTTDFIRAFTIVKSNSEYWRLKFKLDEKTFNSLIALFDMALGEGMIKEERSQSIETKLRERKTELNTLEPV